MLTLERQLANLESERVALLEQMEALGEKSVELYVKIQEIRDTIVEREIAKSNQPNWSLLLKEQNSMVAYKALEKALREFGIGSSGYNPTTMQRILQVSLYKYHEEGMEKLQKTFEGLQKVLPHIKAVDGWKAVDVLESTLSRLGFYKLYVSEDACELRKTTYGSERVIFNSDSLFETLKYIQKHHAYDQDEK